MVESADVELTTRVQNPSDVASGVDCDVGDGLFATSFANTVNTLAMPKLADPSLLNVVFNYRTSGHTCLFGSGDTTSCCDSQTFGSTINKDTVIVGLENIAEFLDISAVNVKLTLAHELGHALGLSHDTAAGHCTTPDNSDLMCNGDSLGQTVSDHVEGCEVWEGKAQSPTPLNCAPRGDADGLLTCSLARAGARARLPDATPPTLSLGPDQTVECTSPAGATVPLSSNAADPESGISSVLWTENGTSIGGGAQISPVVPLGTSTFSAIATNGKVLTSTGNVKVTVQDTAPPVVSATSAISLTGCASGGSLTLTPPTATDVGSASVTVTGSVVSSGGTPLNPPLPVTNGQVVLAPGSYVVEWTATDAHGNTAKAQQSVSVLACMTAADSFMVGNGAQIKTPEGTPVDLVNLGAGTVELGVQASTGGITSRGVVQLDDRSVVNGSIRTAATLTRQNQVTVSGSVTEHAALSLPVGPTISGTWPTSPASAIDIEPNHVLALHAGSFLSLAVKTGAVLTLAPGAYYFTSLATEPGSTMRTSGATTINVRDAITHRGSVLDGSGNPSASALRFWGTSAVSLEPGWFGSVLAPSAAVMIGGAPSTSFRGQIFAKRIEVRPNVVIVATTPPTGGLLQVQSLHPGESGKRDILPASAASFDGESSCTIAQLGKRRDPSRALFTLLVVVGSIAVRRRRIVARKRTSTRA